MSADNWEICPRCLARAGRAYVELSCIVSDVYETIPPELQKFIVAKTEPPNEEDYRTFREDYEFYVDGETLNISYSGRCTECALAKDYKETSPIEGVNE